MAAAGIFLYSQLGDIFSLGLTFVGLLTVIVGSVIWARRSSIDAPLWIGISIGLAAFLYGWFGDVNVHGPSAIVMFLIPFSIVDVLCVLIGSGF